MVFIASATSTVDTCLKKRSHVDLSRHLSLEARARLPNPIKSIWKAAQVKPGTINMGNGLWASLMLHTPSNLNLTQVILIIHCIPYAR